MRALPGLRRILRPPISAHQGGWDEALLFFGVPLVLFVVLRWLGIRRERRESAEGHDSNEN